MNRGEIKWQPFNAVVSSSLVMKELKKKRNKKTMPLLSEDEKEVLNELLMKAYHTHEKILVVYFFHDQYFKKISRINAIDVNERKVYFTDRTSLYLEQFIKIKLQF